MGVKLIPLEGRSFLNCWKRRRQENHGRTHGNLWKSQKSGNFVDLDANTKDGVWHDQLVCDCTAMHISDAEGHTLATVPLHQIASVGFVRESPHNFLAIKVGDVVPEAPDLFDVLVLLAPSEEVAEQVCQHFVHCFQFLYREAIAAMEQLQLQEEADLEQLELASGLARKGQHLKTSCTSITGNNKIKKCCDFFYGSVDTFRSFWDGKPVANHKHWEESISHTSIFGSSID